MRNTLFLCRARVSCPQKSAGKSRSVIGTVATQVKRPGCRGVSCLLETGRCYRQLFPILYLSTTRCCSVQRVSRTFCQLVAASVIPPPSVTAPAAAAIHHQQQNVQIDAARDEGHPTPLHVLASVVCHISEVNRLPLPTPPPPLSHPQCQ